MVISIWRYSHLSLAISSFLFLSILSFTGIILSFDPMIEEVKTYSIPKASEQSVQQTLELLQKNYEEIIELEITDNYLVKITGVDTNGNSGVVYVNPINGKPVAKLREQHAVFKWATSLHRSLFLKSTGRIVVGVSSFLLFLIAISGTLLIIKRQGSLKAVFTKVVKDNFYEFYHVFFSRLLLFPIVIIAFTGVYLSLEKFSLLPKQQEKHQIDYAQISQKTTTQNIPVFSNTFLKDVKKIEFPFSNDVEDYFVLRLIDKELYIHQYTGDILSKINITNWKQLYSWSFILHTGKGNFLWSLVLLASSLAILFFIYSGFNITWQRIQKKGKKIKNKFAPNQATHVILVGSETGSTFSFATSFYNALIKVNKKAYICSLNNYIPFEYAEHVIIITATYGDGEPPKNAEKFFSKFQQRPIKHRVSFSVVGFGSTAYPHFCKYAIDVDNFLSKYPNVHALQPIAKINQQSFNVFQQWATDWGNSVDLNLELEEIKQKTTKYKVVHKTDLDTNNTFMLHLKPLKKQTIFSGDLIGFKPSKEQQKRLYSVAIINKNIVLSIKKHQYGLCSNYLFSLKEGDTVNAYLTPNKSFYIPKKATKVLLIANGTGIAPFLGMIDENKQQKKLDLLVGFKNPDASKMYQPILEKSLENKCIDQVHYAYSRTQKTYVQDILLQKSAIVVTTLKNNGVILICGSLKMRDGVFDALEKITLEHLQLPLSHFKDNEMIKSDCY